MSGNNKELRNRYKCKYCLKGYMREDAKKIHEKVCPWREEDE